MYNIQWIPVEKRLPAVTEEPFDYQHGYLVTTAHLNYPISAAYYYSDEGECIWVAGGFTLEDVVAWAKAPSIYDPLAEQVKEEVRKAMQMPSYGKFPNPLLQGIKRYRSLTGATLRDAKEYVTGLMAEL